MAEVRQERRTAPQAHERDVERDRMEERYRAPVGAQPATINRSSWGAILGGAVVALVIHLLMGVLGIAIGLTLMEPLTGEITLQAVGVAVGIWWILTAVVAFFLGGWTAGRLSGMPLHQDTILHGIIVWGVVMLASFYLAATGAGEVVIIEGPFAAVANALTAGAWWALIVMVVGALAAAGGGAVGTPRDLPASSQGGRQR